MRIVIIFILFSVFLNGCNNCKECDNKLEYILGTYPDKNESVVEFGVNDSVKRYDTVKIEYNPPEKYYDCPLDKEGTMSCGGSINILIDNFSLKIFQGVNIYGNEISKNISYKTGVYYYGFDLRDTVNIDVMDSVILVKHYKINSLLDIPKKYCNEIYTTFDDRLIQYNIINGDSVEIWKRKIK